MRTLDLSHNHLAYLSPTLTELSPDFLDVEDNRLCFPEDSRDSAALRQMAWLDAMDRDWRITQTCP